eukprot:TRINITY_DN512_c0_g1_i2.p2 TRINITY_DN512_c0_g1~~TRINITY_DN512_c0_g1_i2.p2  ORF type:complete len:169 (+),score=6.96 TRINITY_DN512_c0_g1_i2:554-1060(+)
MQSPVAGKQTFRGKRFPCCREWKPSESETGNTAPGAPPSQSPLIVLDRFVKQHDIEWVDFLSIDTEGHDSRVLRGANRILEKVRYLEFEYHSIGVWKSTSLREVIAFLEHRGHTCYWIGRGKAWLITGCWHPSYATKRWSNIGCVNRRVPRWAAIMDTVFRSTVSLAP